MSTALLRSFLTRVDGLGKTSITLAALKLLLKAGTARKILVIAPLRVCLTTWPAEAARWSDFSHLRLEILHGPRKAERLRAGADLYLINPEGLDWLLGVTKTASPSDSRRKAIAVDLRAFHALGFDTLVVDELTTLKNHASDRFKALRQVLSTFNRRWGLTGSPAANGLEPLFGQLYVLDEGRSLGRYITHYRREFFTPAPSGYGWALQAGAAERIYARIAPLVLRLGAEELDLPALVTNPIRVELPAAARAAYDAVEEDLFLQLDEGRVSAASAGVALGKCRQLASGAVFLSPDVEALVRLPTRDRRVAVVHDEKLEALRELIEELQGQPLLVAYEFTHELERLRQAFPAMRFVADVPPRRFKELEAAWLRGEVSLLAGHPSTLARGLNLQGGAAHVCWFTLTWDYELYDQFIRRIWRQGSTQTRVFVHHLIAVDTVDEVVAAALTRKERGQKALFTAIQQRRGGRGAARSRCA